MLHPVWPILRAALNANSDCSITPELPLMSFYFHIVNVLSNSKFPFISLI